MSILKGKKIAFSTTMIAVGMSAMFWQQGALGQICYDKLTDSSWRKLVHCANGSVRLEAMRTGAYSQRIQLVVNHNDAIAHLRNGGGINPADINAKGEFILDRVQDGGRSHMTLLALRPRDQGQLVYKITASPENKKLTLTVAYDEVDISQDARPFVGYDFYDCSF